MIPFIYPFQANYVRSELTKLLRVVYFVGDYRVYQATKDAVQSNISSLFGSLTAEQESLFHGITAIKGQQELNEFMDRIGPYVIPFDFDVQNVRKLFRREKKLVIPDPKDFDLRAMTYLGWRDIGTKSIYLIYPYLGELTGVRGRYATGNTATNMCCICNHTLTGSEVGLVVAKTQSSTYRSVGNYMCLDSTACNHRMTDTRNIEAFFQKALTK